MRDRTPDVRDDRAARRVEEAGLNALQTERQLFYDGWLLRLSPGKAKRARSVTAHFASSLPLEEKIAYCEQVYARHELPVLFRLTPFAHPQDLETVLRARGYVPFEETLVQVAPLHAPPECPAIAEDARVESVDAVAFAHAAAALRSSSPKQLEAHLARLANSPLEARHVVVHAEDRVVTTAQIACEGDLAGIFDVVTAADARGRGYATAAVARLVMWAWERAVATMYLQVNASNAAALAIYRKFGFSTLYSYHYCALPRDVEA